jgi:predicted helicase
MVNTIELNKARPPQVDIFHVTDTSEAGDAAASPDTPRPVAYQPMLQLEALDNWREAIYARMVDKVGSRRYWETWAKDVADIVERHTTRLRTLIEQPGTATQFEEFVAALRANLNDSITADAAIDMLSQHLVTRPVFDALFPGYEFTDHNPVARVMQAMLTALEGSNLESETEALAEFYESVRLRAAGIDNAEGKQRVITELYEKFFRLAFPRSADALGIVYTPTEIVDFILRSVNDLLVTEFGTTISAPGVHVLDPFTGTGTSPRRTRWGRPPATTTTPTCTTRAWTPGSRRRMPTGRARRTRTASTTRTSARSAGRATGSGMPGSSGS